MYTLLLAYEDTRQNGNGILYVAGNSNAPSAIGELALKSAHRHLHGSKAALGSAFQVALKTLPMHLKVRRPLRSI